MEFKVNDDRYFVLTFVLCGCIAGILLAVVVIYLIRRNSRSKAKLQQIASVQETGEAASKDYQVSKIFTQVGVFESGENNNVINQVFTAVWCAVGAGGVVWTFFLLSIFSPFFLPLCRRRPYID